MCPAGPPRTVEILEVTAGGTRLDNRSCVFRGAPFGLFDIGIQVASDYLKTNPVMIWEKKPRPEPAKAPEPLWVPPVEPKLESPVTDTISRPSSSAEPFKVSTVLGRSVVLHGEITANEDLLIEGQCDGTINVQEHCLTVGPEGRVKAQIHARQVVIHGSIEGNISAREKIEIRKTGSVLGDLTAPGIAIDDGAYVKGSIEILREEPAKAPRVVSAVGGRPADEE